jgi:hypothetical protein
MEQEMVTLMTAGVIRTHKAREMGLCTAGDGHSIINVSNIGLAVCFVISVGPPDLFCV